MKPEFITLPNGDVVRASAIVAVRSQSDWSFVVHLVGGIGIVILCEDKADQARKIKSILNPPEIFDEAV